MSRSRRIALVVVVCVQLALPLALAETADRADLAFGREIRLQAQPVDPLDVFRGNYVVLRYEISTLPVLGDVRRGERVCARPTGVGRRLAARATPTRVSHRHRDLRPRARRRGVSESVGIEYGIETYYASAEQAREVGPRSRAAGSTSSSTSTTTAARIERLEGA